MTKQKYQLAVTALSFILLSDAAMAQAVGGNGSFLSGLVNYASQNVVPSIAIIGLIAAGFALAFTRFAGLSFVLFVAAGIYIASNAQTLMQYVRQ